MHWSYTHTYPTPFRQNQNLVSFWCCSVSGTVHADLFLQYSAMYVAHTGSGWYGWRNLVSWANNSKEIFRSILVSLAHGVAGMEFSTPLIRCLCMFELEKKLGQSFALVPVQNPSAPEELREWLWLQDNHDHLLAGWLGVCGIWECVYPYRSPFETLLKEDVNMWISSSLSTNNTCPVQLHRILVLLLDSIPFQIGSYTMPSTVVSEHLPVVHWARWLTSVTRLFSNPLPRRSSVWSGALHLGFFYKVKEMHLALTA